VVNDPRSGGTGGQIATASLGGGIWAKSIVVHEIGHIFGLADEYFDEQYAQATGRTRDNVRTIPNVDLTDDLSQIKWKHFVGLPGYIDSAWEGGYYFLTGVWRPVRTSLMGSNDIFAFNAISRETIVKAILKNAGEVYSFSEFLNRDIIPTYSAVTASDGSLAPPMPVPVEVYADQLYGKQKIRARFCGEDK